MCVTWVRVVQLACKLFCNKAYQVQYFIVVTFINSKESLESLIKECDIVWILCTIMHVIDNALVFFLIGFMLNAYIFT